MSILTSALDLGHRSVSGEVTPALSIVGNSGGADTQGVIWVGAQPGSPAS